jgi:NAD(P)-dependent dehydrogenase (short-subunit alcohol dehydrogenase family)
VAEDIKHLTTKRLDLQIGVNLRAVPLFYREALEMLTTTAAAHGQAHVINVASISGKHGEAGLSAYSASKSAVVGFTQAMNRELGSAGVKSCAICPAWVDTPMSDFVKTQIAPARMITVQDVCELVVALLRLSPGCTVPEIILEQTATHATEWRSTETPAHLPGEGHGG